MGSGNRSGGFAGFRLRNRPRRARHFLDVARQLGCLRGSTSWSYSWACMVGRRNAGWTVPILPGRGHPARDARGLRAQVDGRTLESASPPAHHHGGAAHHIDGRDPRLHNARGGVDFPTWPAGATLISLRTSTVSAASATSTVPQQRRSPFRHLKKPSRRLDYGGRRWPTHLVVYRRNPYALGGLQHYKQPSNPLELERTKFLLLRSGLRLAKAAARFPGYWLYSGGQATVHLMARARPLRSSLVPWHENKVRIHNRPPRPHRLCLRRPMSTCAQAPQSRGRKFRGEHRGRVPADTQFLLYDPEGVVWS